MKISLIYTTARIGSFDMILNSAANQAMDKADFEVIVVDELYDWRAKLVAETVKARFAHINFTHVPPRIKHEYYDNTHGFNTGLRLATGELIAFMIDYTWLKPDYLTSHWDFYQKNPGRTQSGFIDRFDFPLIHDEHKTFSGHTDSYRLWSVFEYEFDRAFADEWFSRKPVYRERKGGIVMTYGADMPGDRIYLVGDSIPREVLEALNGLDERYDDGYGVNDIDLGMRANAFGWRFGVNPDCIVYKLGTHDMSQARIPGAYKPVNRPDNHPMFYARRDAINNRREYLPVVYGYGAWE